MVFVIHQFDVSVNQTNNYFVDFFDHYYCVNKVDSNRIQYYYFIDVIAIIVDIVVVLDVNVDNNLIYDPY